MTFTVPGWLWGLLAGLAAAAGLVVFYLAGTRQRRPGEIVDPFQDVPALYLETSAQELKRAERVDVQAQAHQDQVAEVLANPDPDARTRDLAELLNRWSP